MHQYLSVLVVFTLVVIVIAVILFVNIIVINYIAASVFGVAIALLKSSRIVVVIIIVIRLHMTLLEPVFLEVERWLCLWLTVRCEVELLVEFVDNLFVVLEMYLFIVSVFGGLNV